MRKPILAVLCLALVCGYDLAAPLFASSDPPPASVKAKLGWKFKDGTTPGPDDKVEPPYILRKAHAQYAEEPRKRRLQGDVVLDVEVDENGDVVDAVVTRSLEPSLDANAVTAVRKWKYRAARLNGTPKASLVEAVVKYRVG